MNFHLLFFSPLIMLFWKGDQAFLTFIKLVLVVIFMALVVILMLWLIGLLKKKTGKQRAEEETPEGKIPSSLVARCNEEVSSTIISLAKNYYLVIDSLLTDDHARLEKNLAEIEDINTKAKELKRNIPQAIRQLDEEAIESAVYYVQVLDYLREASHCLTFIARPVHEHLQGKQPVMIPEQKAELAKINESISEFYNFTLNLLTKGKYGQLGEIIQKQQMLLEEISTINKSQLKRVKKGESSTRASMLYLDVLGETKNLLLHTINILKAQRDFINSQRNY
jgi:Na+/phosphate symporter